LRFGLICGGDMSEEQADEGNVGGDRVERGEAPLPILELSQVSKHFGAIHALNEVDMALDEGEVLGLMGDNGAGKSTLVKVIAGNFPPTHGEVRIAGEAVHFHKPVEAREKGVEVVYQDLALCNNLSAAANVFLGREIKRGAGPLR